MQIETLNSGSTDSLMDMGSRQADNMFSVFQKPCSLCCSRKQLRDCWQNITTEKKLVIFIKTGVERALWNRKLVKCFTFRETFQNGPLTFCFCKWSVNKNARQIRNLALNVAPSIKLEMQVGITPPTLPILSCFSRIIFLEGVIKITSLSKLICQGGIIMSYQW